MSSIFTIDVHRSLTNLRDEIYDALSKPYLMWDVEFYDQIFHIDNSNDDSHEDKLNLIRLLLHDALSAYAHACVTDDTAPAQSFNRIEAIISNIPSQESIQSPLSPESYEEIKVEAKKSVDLNYDAYHVKMQNKNLNLNYFKVPDVVEDGDIKDYVSHDCLVDFTSHNCGCGKTDKPGSC